jgi:hypothetical protein
MTDDALRAWLPIAFGTALLVFAGVSIRRGKLFEGFFRENMVVSTWTYRRKKPFLYWSGVLTFAAAGLFAVGLGVGKLLGFAFR